MSEYLDTKKSVIISAPAGSGKTEKLSRRYISLLEDGNDLEKILAITFTEKAAAEMKDRILNILLKEKPDLFEKIRERIPLMRITTIHAFCRKLITRFSMELGLDPSLEVIEEFRADQLWYESIYDTLRDEQEGPAHFFEYLKLKGIKGWGILYNTLDVMHRRRPYTEFLLDARSPNSLQPFSCQVGRDQGLDSEEDRLLILYGLCFEKYRRRKQELGVIDFNDMEVLAHRAISSNPEWMNILYAFDEHTDHILVDEFQDTNSIQWRIIDRLTEEWRSGLGAKRSGGKVPTVFLVGDEKQSIYMFRGANVSIFQEVRSKFREWFGEEAVFHEAKENYRSLPGIINFTNRLFGPLMTGSLAEAWRTRYSPFSPTREGDGSVELMLLDPEKNSKQTRMKEAALISQKILSIAGCLDTYSASPLAKCRYSDIAVLLRNRTHLPSFETAFSRMKIPYVVIGGIGFYDEPEVAVLRELVSFFADPGDDFSLFAVLRSPLFGLPEAALFPYLSGRKKSLYENMAAADSSRTKKAKELLDKYLAAIYSRPLAVLLEEFLTEAKGWEIFWETQRHANIKKFLMVLEYYESEALSLAEIREKLIQSRKSGEAKANVNTESLDAVKIMTVHGAKGLQFPVVFLPSLDEKNSSKGGAIFLDEVDNEIRFSYEEDSARRSKNGLFMLRKEKEGEEEKRLFYVAVTRAMDHLFMSGSVKSDEKGGLKIQGKLALMEEAFPGCISGTGTFDDTFKIVREKDLRAAAPPQGAFLERDSGRFLQEPVYTEGIGLSSQSRPWVDVTEDIDARTRHGEDWAVLGSVFHRLFEEISRGFMDYNDLAARTETLLKNEPSLKSDRERYLKLILRDFVKLEEAGYLKDIIMPLPSASGGRERGYAELPFILQKRERVYKGRIDRIIIKDDCAYIYDYKTFPASEREITELSEKYRFQMDIYSEACKDLFSLKTRSFILFTHRPYLVEV